jgi:hypothetical protein
LAGLLTSGVQYEGDLTLEASPPGAHPEARYWRLTSLNLFGDYCIFDERDILAAQVLQDAGGLKQGVYSFDALRSLNPYPELLTPDVRARVRLFVRRGAPCVQITHNQSIVGEAREAMLCTPFICPPELGEG